MLTRQEKSATAKAVKALNQFWEAVKEMESEEFDELTLTFCKWNTSSFSIEHVKQDLENYLTR